MTPEELQLLAERLGARQEITPEEGAALVTGFNPNSTIDFNPTSNVLGQDLGVGSATSLLALNDALVGTNLSQSLGSRLNKQSDQLFALQNNNVLGKALDSGMQQEAKFEKDLRDQLSQLSNTTFNERKFDQQQANSDRTFEAQERQRRFQRSQVREKNRLAKISREKAEKQSSLDSQTGIGAVQNIAKNSFGLDGYLSNLSNRAYKDQATKTAKINAFAKDIDSAKKFSLKISEANQRADNIISALQDPSVRGAALGGIATSLAKLAGETGVLTDTDIKRFQGNPSLFEKFKRFKAANFEGDFPESTREELQALATLYLENANKRYATVVGDTIRGATVSFANPGEERDEVARELLNRGILEELKSPYDAEELDLFDDKGSLKKRKNVKIGRKKKSGTISGSDALSKWRASRK